MGMTRWYRTQRFKIKWPWKGLNFSGPHVTHDLPREITAAGLSWTPMQVWESPLAKEPIYRCEFPAANWQPRYANYEYGFGNFYSLDGHLTHYHNWYNRADEVSEDSHEVHKNRFSSACLLPRLWTAISEGLFAWPGATA